MAGYLSPAAYMYVEEQEYLQAYEDVLERYKGTRSLRWAVRRGRAHGNRYLSQIKVTPAWAQVNSSRNQPWGPPGALGEILYPRAGPCG